MQRAIVLGRVAAAVVVVGVALLTLPDASRAQDSRKADPKRNYSRTITEREADDLIAGAKLDKKDPAYCEKARDICLAGLCGSIDPEKIAHACWEHCANEGYSECVDENR